MAPQSVLTTTLRLLRDKMVDNSFLSHPLLRAIDEAGNKVEQAGGSKIDTPVIFGEHSNISEYTNGFEPQNMAITDPFFNASFDWANFSAPIVINKVEELANRGDLAVVNVLESKMKNVVLSLKKQINKQIVRGDSASITQLQTLNGMGVAGGTTDTTGWLEAVVAASQVNVIGGLSKATYQSKNWFTQFIDAGGTLTLAQIDRLMTRCQLYNPEGGRPDILLMSEGAWGAFQALHQSQVQYVAPDSAAALDKDMVGMWRGAKIYVDPNLGFTAITPAKAVSIMALTSANFKLYVDPDAYLSVGDMLPVPGTITSAATVMNRMQLVTGHIASHGVIVDGEA